MEQWIVRAQGPLKVGRPIAHDSVNSLCAVTVRTLDFTSDCYFDPSRIE
jgi:hypothetical protein